MRLASGPALCVATVALGAACASFESKDAPVSDDAGASDAGVGDAAAATDAAPATFCKTPIDSQKADFLMGKTVFQFSEEPGDGGTVVWSDNEGSPTPGSLEAIVLGGDTQAQIERDFPIGSATRARLSFAARIKTVPTSGLVSLGCTLQLSTTPVAPSTSTWVALLIVIKTGAFKLAQDSSVGGSSKPSVALDNASTDWKRFAFEMTDVTSTSVRYRVFYGSQDVTPADATIPLQSPPERFRVKCGIDEADVAADTFTDDVAFEMCANP